MNLRPLITQLNDRDLEKRIDAARIIGMLEEVDLKDALAQAYKREPDGSVKAVMYWAGKRLQQAQAAGYTTLNGLWKYYQIDRDVIIDTEEEERRQYAAYMKAYEEEARQQTLFKGVARTAGSALSIGMGPVDPLLAAATYVASEAAIQSYTPKIEPQVQQTSDEGKRVKPVAPGDSAIAPHVKRLMQHPDPDQRRKAAATLADVNNLAALSPLALACKEDADESVREAAKTAGQRIYWNSVYWTLEQNGFIEQEIARRRSAGIVVQTPAPAAPQAQAQPQLQPAAVPEMSEEEKAAKEREALDAILKRKMEEQAKRKKR